MTHTTPASNSAPVPGSSAGVHFCTTCKHMQRRPAPRLFNGQELQTPGGIKAATEWEVQEKQFAQREEQQKATGEPFTWEPHHYAWCDAFTKVDVVRAANAGDTEAQEQLMREGGAELNPVTGEFSPLYYICVCLNHNGRCQSYEPTQP